MSGGVVPFTRLYEGPVHWQRTLRLILDPKNTPPDVILVPPVPGAAELTDSTVFLPNGRAQRLIMALENDPEVHFATSRLQACLFSAYLRSHDEEARALMNHHVKRIISAPKGPLPNWVLLCVHVCVTLEKYTRDGTWRTNVANEYAIGRQTDPDTVPHKDGERNEKWKLQAASHVFSLQLILTELAYVDRPPPSPRLPLDQIDGALCIVCGNPFNSTEFGNSIRDEDLSEYRALASTAFRDLRGVNNDFVYMVIAGLLCTGGQRHVPFIMQCARERRGMVPFI